MVLSRSSFRPDAVSIAERVQARLDAAFADRDEQPGTTYIRAKAEIFLRIGADAYRTADVFHQPDIRLSPENLDAVVRGVVGIMDGKGFSSANPLTYMPAEFSHSLANLFHFEIVAQKARRSEDRLNFLDALLCRHRVDGREVVLFNLVPGARLRKAMGEMP